MSPALHRREVLAGLLGLPLASLLGCGESANLPAAGEIVGVAHALGHRLRQPQTFDLQEDAYETARVVIVGGGVAGLSAAWKLQRSGVEDFLLLELEDVAGGTARSGTLANIEHPWGAHYLPAPTAANAPLVELLDEMGLIEGYRDDGEPIYAEQHLCRDPEERVFVGGQWHEGLFPHAIATSDDLAQLARFRREIDRWIAWRDAHGRRAFTTPVALCSDAPEVTALDRISLAQWLAERKFTSPPLLWWIEYATRDDYGLTLDLVSAWAGLFYFAARVSTPGEDSQPFLTWPAGNGRLVQHLVKRVASHIRTGEAVAKIQQAISGEFNIHVLTRDGQPRGYRAQHAIFAAPQFLVPYILTDCSTQRRADAREFQYGAWLVANLLLRDRPHNVGFAPAWDNVLYSSSSLGYVAATHQSGHDHGPTVWTYYYPFCQRDPSEGRTHLLESDWPTLAEFVLQDLAAAHPDLRALVERLDVMLWGHAMIQPRVGFMTGGARLRAAQAEGNIHFAHTDLSGVALFEEAFAHGLRAAEEVLQTL